MHKIKLKNNRFILSLKNQPEFDSINSRGIKYNARAFMLVILKKSHDDSSNKRDNESFCMQHFFGMKVGKKLGNAVVRNKIKRRIKHLIRLVFANKTTEFSLSIIFVPRKNFEKIQFNVILQQLNNIFIKL